MLEAAPSVLEDFPKTIFAFLGGMPKFVKRTDYLQIWLGLAERLKIAKNVRFLGEVGHRDTLAYYHATDMFVFPTLYEGLAKALLEAMACQLPIVATDVGGNRDALKNRRNGLLVKPYGSKELATAVVEVLSNQTFARRMGENARQTVCANFTWKNVAEKIHKVYEEVRGLSN
jgi:glycosyltransferase involved in cell wall biosynthesis